MRRVAPPGAVLRAPLSPGLIVEGPLLFVSGQVPMRDGELITGTIEEQTELVLANLGAILAAGGAGFADVVRCQVFLADLADFDRMNAVYARCFSDPQPTRTTVGAQLYGGCAVEIDCIAVPPRP
jgi:2-iminobutanoate/2-iminopropanoate deaminase